FVVSTTISPGVEVTRYPVIALPPLSAGSVNVIVTSPLPATAVTPVGASGTVFGVTASDAAEAALAPAAFNASTVNVYDVPFVNPPTPPALASVSVAFTISPGVEVTRYP